jgi:hypothetical protein
MFSPSPALRETEGPAAKPWEGEGSYATPYFLNQASIRPQASFAASAL